MYVPEMNSLIISFMFQYHKHIPASWWWHFFRLWRISIRRAYLSSDIVCSHFLHPICERFQPFSILADCLLFQHDPVERSVIGKYSSTHIKKWRIIHVYAKQHAGTWGWSPDAWVIMNGCGVRTAGRGNLLWVNHVFITSQNHENWNNATVSQR